MPCLWRRHPPRGPSGRHAAPLATACGGRGHHLGAYFGSAPWAEGFTLAEWFLPRILELTYTAWDLRPFARDCGYEGPPFGWDDERRFLLRCEIDAAYFHLYGLARDDVNHVMDTFTIVKRRDVEQHGDYRTKAMILEIYDRMTGAVPPGRIPHRPQSSGGA